jgi:hypothetical protein
VFGHGRLYQPDGSLAVIASYHPSRQNTNTGKLTPTMLEDVFRMAAQLTNGRPSNGGRSGLGGALRTIHVRRLSEEHLG